MCTTCFWGGIRKQNLESFVMLARLEYDRLYEGVSLPDWSGNCWDIDLAYEVGKERSSKFVCDIFLEIPAN